MTEVVIAVRGGPESKSRCACMLDAQGRMRLVEAMLIDMLEAVRGASGVTVVHVVTPTMALAELAARCGASPIIELAQRGVNVAFDLARRRIAMRAEEATLVLLPGDLPMLDARDVECAAQLHTAGSLVIGPSLDGEGTGALVLSAGAPFTFSFGPNSFRRHVADARRHHLAIRVIGSPGLRHDIDAPGDLERLLLQGGRGRTVSLLRTLRGEGAFACTQEDLRQPLA